MYTIFIETEVQFDYEVIENAKNDSHKHYRTLKAAKHHLLDLCDTYDETEEYAYEMEDSKTLVLYKSELIDGKRYSTTRTLTIEKVGE